MLSNSILKGIKNVLFPDNDCLKNSTKLLTATENNNKTIFRKSIPQREDLRIKSDLLVAFNKKHKRMLILL